MYNINSSYYLLKERRNPLSKSVLFAFSFVLLIIALTDFFTFKLTSDFYRKEILDHISIVDVEQVEERQNNSSPKKSGQIVYVGVAMPKSDLSFEDEKDCKSAKSFISENGNSCKCINTVESDLLPKYKIFVFQLSLNKKD